MKRLFILSLAVLMSSFSVKALAIECDQVETLGSTISGALEQHLLDEYGGEVIDITDSQKLKIGEFNDVKFSKCDLSMWVTFDLNREVFSDTNGRIQLTGVVTEIDEKHLCVKDLKAPKLEMQSASEIEIELYRMVAVKSLPETDCIDFAE